MLFNVDIVNLLLKKQWEETQSISFYFRGLKCCGCQGGGRGVWGGGGGDVKQQKVLFRAA